MNRKYIAAGLIGIAAIVGWNIFLVQRDAKMFEAYNQPTPKERFCQQQAGWHPDCNVE
jgi:hypothetical protein